MRVVVRSVAETEMTETWEYYEAIRPSLAEDFLEKVDEALARAAEHPYGYACQGAANQIHPRSGQADPLLSLTPALRTSRCAWRSPV